jgi:hypothetical protein
MARYSSFLGRRVEVQYRASDTLLPASGVFVADSGRSIFLEESFEQRGQHRHFRWEIPYQFLVKIALTNVEDSEPSASSDDSGEQLEDANTEEATPAADAAVRGVAASEKLFSSAAAGAGISPVLTPFSKPTHSL